MALMAVLARDALKALKEDYNECYNDYEDSVFTGVNQEACARRLAEHEYLHLIRGRPFLFARYVHTADNNYIVYEDISDSSDPTNWRNRALPSSYQSLPLWLPPRASDNAPWTYNPLKGLLFDPTTQVMHNVFANGSTPPQGPFTSVTFWMLRNPCFTEERLATFLYKN